MPALIASGIGAVAGGLGGLFGGGKAPQLQQAKRINKFKGVLGTATPDGFTFEQDANRQAAVDSGNQQLASLLAGGFNIDQQRLNDFQNAFLAQRQPQQERQLAQQQQQGNVQSSTQGTTGNSADLFRNALQNQFANEQRNALLNQSIQGREQLANTALQQQLSQGGFLSDFSQGDVTNQLNAQQSTLQDLFNSQQNEINFTNSANQVSDANAANAKSSNKFGNFLSGALSGAQAGSSLGSAFGGGGGGLSGLFGGGSPAGSFTSPSLAQNSGVSLGGSTPDFNFNSF